MPPVSCSRMGGVCMFEPSCGHSGFGAIMVTQVHAQDDDTQEMKEVTGVRLNNTNHSVQ